MNVPLTSLVKQSTARVVPVFLGSTGEVVLVYLRKPGGGFSPLGAPDVVEVAHGWYDVSLGAGHTDTLGDLVLGFEFGAFAGVDMKTARFQVVKDLPGKPTAAEIAEALSGAEITLQSALSGGSLTIHHGAEYSAANGNRVPFRFTTLPDLTGGSAKLIVSVAKGAVLFEHPLPIEDAGQATQTIWFELTGEKSSKVQPPAVYVGTIAYKAAGATAFAVARELAVATRRM